MLDLLRIVALLISPVLIDTSNQILDYLNVNSMQRTGIDQLIYGLLQANYPIQTNVPILFHPTNCRCDTCKHKAIE
jgi:hypothetical protein